MTIIRLLYLTILTGCEPFSAVIEQEDNRETARNLAANDDNLQYYPISNYEKYPNSVRSLIRQADIEDGQCRGIFDKSTLHACNRREVIMFELEKKGWCYGGSLVGFEMHWLKCADDPYYRPGGHGPDALYTKEEIEEMTEYLDQ